MPSIGRRATQDTRFAAAMASAMRARLRPAYAMLSDLTRRQVRRLLRWFETGRFLAIRPLSIFASLAGLAALFVFVPVQEAAGTLVSRASLLAGFRIDDVRLSGEKEITKIDVLTTLDLGPERSLFTFDVHAARDSLKELPWIADVTVAKAYPDVLKVAVVERTPFAVWQRNDELWLIARDGAEIVPFDDRFANLPLVVGSGANETAAEFLSLTSRFPAIRQQVSAHVHVGKRRWNLVLRNGITILLPEADPESALRDLLQMQEKHDLFARDIARIDLRLPDRLVLGLTESGIGTLQEAGLFQDVVSGQEGAR